MLFFGKIVGALINYHYICSVMYRVVDRYNRTVKALLVYQTLQFAV